jgi:decaprenylphospho-beta-D-erythro-pentofuranosid-2-ulose 2-reductase
MLYLRNNHQLPIRKIEHQRIASLMRATERPVLILGARSDIGRAIAHRYAREGHSIMLAARNVETLAADRISLVEFDVTHPPQALLERLPSNLGVVVCVVGDMGDQAVSERDPDAATKVMETNYVGPARVMGALVERMAPNGVMIGISSVAGDRGRATNYVYGSAKAGFTAFLSGLRNRLAKTGVHVITLKPGFVNTRMTAGMKLPKRLTAEPADVAEAVYQAHSKQKDVVYTKSIWRIVMKIICTIPEGVFKKTNI